MRKKANDAVELSRNGLIALFAVLAVVFLLAAVIGIKPKDEPPAEVTVDVEIEADPGAVKYELLSAENKPLDMPDGRETEIVVPCGIDRPALIATMKSALLQSHIEHSYKSCHRVRVYLDGLWPAICAPVAVGYLCKEACEGGLKSAGWDFKIRLIPRKEWPEMDEARLVQMCTYLGRTMSCPWSGGFDEKTAYEKLVKDLSLDPAEARAVIDNGKKLGSADGYYRQSLRRRNY